MDKSLIASNIRRLREARSWTQEQLAAAARLDVRTIQRAEAGRLLAAETLQAVAGAFDEPVASLSLPQVDAEKLAASLHARHVFIHMELIDRASALEPLMGSDAFSFHKLGLSSDAEEDAATELEQVLTDALNIWNDLEPLQRRDLVRDFQAEVDALRGLHLAVTAGIQTIREKVSNGRTSLLLHILYVAVSPMTKPALILAREKTEPVSFA